MFLFFPTYNNNVIFSKNNYYEVGKKHLCASDYITERNSYS